MRAKPNYLDPLRGPLPALERAIHKYRTLLMVLVIYHAEELKHEIVEDVLARQSFKTGHRQTKKMKWPQALEALQAEEIISAAEREEIAELISFRNDIAHEIHKLFADLSGDKFVRDIGRFQPRKTPFDYEAANRLRDLRALIKERQQAKHWTGVMNFRSMMFESADHIYRDELKRLDKKIRRLMKVRRANLQALNKEFQLGEHWHGFYMPFSPHNQYENGRLTARGVEICYRLFDEGKSPMAVAHLMRVTLNSIKKRHQQWRGFGGPKREPVDFEALPIRKFYRRYDDN
ncbi:MAG: hypothetical protein HC788_02105 [Sphingopyxis sp.]|nr:hypothetical protein [Sphingopyxis sp.]